MDVHHHQQLPGGTGDARLCQSGVATCLTHQGQVRIGTSSWTAEMGSCTHVQLLQPGATTGPLHPQPCTSESLSQPQPHPCAVRLSRKLESGSRAGPEPLGQLLRATVAYCPGQERGRQREQAVERVTTTEGQSKPCQVQTRALRVTCFGAGTQSSAPSCHTAGAQGTAR